MKTYEIECEGETHRIGLDDEGYLYALDHEDEEEERIAVELGDEPAECLRIILQMEAEATRTRTKIFEFGMWKTETSEYVPFSLPMDDAVNEGGTGLVRLIDDIANNQEIRDSAFWTAAFDDRIDIMEILYPRGISEGALNEALRNASEEGNLASIKWLLDHGADIHTKKDYALTWTVEGLNLDIIKFLLERGADPNADWSLVQSIAFMHINYRPKGAEEPSDYTLEEVDTAFNMLLDYGLDVDRAISKARACAWYIANPYKRMEEWWAKNRHRYE